LLKLNERQIEHAMGIAATTAAGLLGSFGTHSKPLHAGKGAMDGIMAAELAARGFEAATDLLEIGNGGMLDALIQDRNADIPPLDFENWEILRNGYKPYASGRASHAVAQAACKLYSSVKGRTIKKVRAQVHTNAGLTMGNPQPRTPLEGKFSVAFCIALGLRGYKLAATDFCDATMRDKAVTGLLPLIEVEVVASQAAHVAHLDVILDDGTVHHADTDMVLGHPANPMSAEDFQAKFRGLVDPVLGSENALRLFNALENFEQPGRMQEIVSLLEGENITPSR
jgi:2-methylcitrate dehydratase PrpD